MKKLTGIVSVCALALLVAPTALAANVADNTDIKTNGSINFTKDTNPDKQGVINQPDETGSENTKEIELPGQGNNGKGLLRIQFVPNFEFGEQTGITAGKVEANVKLLDYNFKGETSKNKIAPFVQVSDERGLSGAESAWQLQVKASPFKGTKDGVEHTLSGVKFVLAESTLTMDYKTSAQAGNFIAGQASDAVIGTDVASPSVKVLETKTGQSTSGFQASNVFYNNYQKDVAPSGTDTTGIKFVKDAGSAPVEGVNYVSTLSWTLTDAK